MEEICSGEFAPRKDQILPREKIRVVNWNIDRGLRLHAIAEFLAFQQADLIILQEVDIGARRTQCLNVAEELAKKLQMNYVFGREFEELTQRTNNGPAFHGQATLSRCLQANARLIRFRRQSDFWRPRWFVPRIQPFQQRLGGRIALVTDVVLSETETLTVYNLHLESRGKDELRFSQLEQAICEVGKHNSRNPTVLAGDLNFDVERHRPAGTAVQRAGFRNALGTRTAQMTTARGFLNRRRRIDWAFHSDAIQTTQGRVHLDVDASDHYPISFSAEIRREVPRQLEAVRRQARN